MPHWSHEGAEVQRYVAGTKSKEERTETCSAATKHVRQWTDEDVERCAAGSHIIKANLSHSLENWALVRRRVRQWSHEDAEVERYDAGSNGEDERIEHRFRRHGRQWTLSRWRPHASSIRTKHVDFCFSVALRPQKPSGLSGTGEPGRPPRLSHSS